MKTKLLILLSLVALLAPMTGQAKPRGQIVAIDNSVFVAMVDPSIEDCIHTQQKGNWCWAACVQMILEYYDEHLLQSSIVEKVFGHSVNHTASGNQIANAFDGWLGFAVRSVQTKTAQSFIDEISAGHPLIIGSGEHAFILTHIYYTKTITLRPQTEHLLRLRS